MRIVLAAFCLAFCAGIAMAQSQSENPQATTDSQGRPLKPNIGGMQDTTAPTNTPGGGAPASSPQGETAPGHMAAPDGSSKVVVEPKK